MMVRANPLPNPSRRKVSWYRVRLGLIGLLSSLLWGWGTSERANAAGIPFQTGFTAIGTQLTTFITAIQGPAALGTTINALCVVIPWMLLMLISAIIVWQVYEGYKEYDRENISGVVKPALNILVVLILLFLSDRAVTFITTGA